MTPRLLPIGSTIYLHKPMLLEGLGTSAQWTANGLGTTTLRMVKHIVEVDSGFWVLIPAGQYKGWRLIGREQVNYVRATPPEDVLAVVQAHEDAIEADKLAKEEAAKQALEGATTGADTQAQTDPDAAA